MNFSYLFKYFGKAYNYPYFLIFGFLLYGSGLISQSLSDAQKNCFIKNIESGELYKISKVEGDEITMYKQFQSYEQVQMSIDNKNTEYELFYPKYGEVLIHQKGDEHIVREDVKDCSKEYFVIERNLHGDKVHETIALKDLVNYSKVLAIQPPLDKQRPKTKNSESLKEVIFSEEDLFKSWNTNFNLAQELLYYGMKKNVPKQRLRLIKSEKENALSMRTISFLVDRGKKKMHFYPIRMTPNEDKRTFHCEMKFTGKRKFIAIINRSDYSKKELEFEVVGFKIKNGKEELELILNDIRELDREK